MKRKTVFILLSIICSVAHAQNGNNQKPCSYPEASQFDFWVGDWELTWNDTSHGTNHIVKIMDGCTVNENFYDPAMKYSGSSWSVYNPQLKIWQQTWVDNQGGYIALTGAFEKDMMTLTAEPRKLPNGKEIVSRMVFYNITPGAFDWRWESTKDSGVSWQPNWLIHYKRKSS
ncbi:MAG: hypothetical protein ABI683_09750 [Ginsengibacter sp.]